MARISSFIGFVIYANQSWFYIHSQESVLDEGNYLVKGLLFVRGQYTIYQDYGPWSNHMPLSFYIPGIVQDIFAPGLRTGRYFAFVLGLLLLIGIWIVARRWGGHWWAVFSIWAMAINPAVIKVYSLMSSQVLISFLLVWVLVFVLDEERELWQILIGSIIAGGLLLTRLNLAPFLPLLLFYIFWQHGKRVGIWSTIAMGGVVLVGHVIFWPGILRMWATWIPTEFAPFLEPFKAPEGAHYWNPSVDLFGRIIAFFIAVKYHFIAILSLIASLLLWPRKEYWKSHHHFRASVFLATSFLVLFIAHFWVSIGAGISSNTAYSVNYCVFCLSGYLAFFSFLGIFLVVIASSSWRNKVSWWRCTLIILIVLLLLVGISLTEPSQISNDFANYRTIRAIMNVEVPRIRDFRFQSGSIELWGLIANRSGLDIEEVHLLVRKFLKTGIAMTFAMLFGLFILVFSWVGYIILRKRGFLLNRSWCFLIMPLFIGVGFILTPYWFLYGNGQNSECNGDVLASYDAVGHHLKEAIPNGSLVYWKGGLSPAPLLYIDEFDVFPPLLNGAYTLREDGSTDALVKYGFWNSFLAQQWVNEANVILIENRLFGDGFVEEMAYSDDFNERIPTPPKNPCQPDSSLRIFLRVP